MLERGHPCSVINLTGFRQEDHDNIYFPKGPFAVVLLLLRLPSRVIHFHIGGELSLRMLLLAWLCCLLPAKKTVLTFHSGGYPTLPSGKTVHPRTLRGFVFRQFDRLIAVNQALATMMEKQFGASPERIRFIYPHALPARVPEVEFPSAMEQFFATHQPVMLSMGWLEPEYDFPLQIAALGPVLDQHPRAGLLILGEGRLGAQLRDQIAATSYAGNVLMPGDVPHDVSLAAIARADIFLRTTHYDGDSISVREALHLGTPVIATDNRMRPPGVRLMPVGDQAALVEAIGFQLAAGKPIRPANPTVDQDNIRAVHDLFQELIKSSGNG